MEYFCSWILVLELLLLINRLSIDLLLVLLRRLNWPLFELIVAVIIFILLTGEISLLRDGEL